MTTKAELETSLKDAMRAGDDVRKRTIRMVLATVKLAEVEKGAAVMDETTLAAVLQKEIKSRRESIAEAQKANRPDLITATEQEIGVLEGFLPKMLPPEELENLARQAIAETGATSLKEMGQVMKALVPRVQGRAPGDAMSQIVKKLLSG